MQAKNPVAATINFLNFHGEQALGGGWKAFVESFVNSLRAKSSTQTEENKAEKKQTENDKDQENVSFLFDDFSTALSAWLITVQNTKKTAGWNPDKGAAPVQVLFHSPRESVSDAKNSLLLDIWHFIKPEQPHASTLLKEQCQSSVKSVQEGKVVFLSEISPGVNPITIEGRAAFSTFQLFPDRMLPIQGSGDECFYCGMKNHLPAKCPSKHLDPEINGLSELGYLSMNQLRESYGKAFPHQTLLLDEIKKGLDQGAVRRRQDLQAYCAFFDLNRCFQLRFLYQLCFSFSGKWPDTLKSDVSIRHTGNALRLGFDCLRVGNYGKAGGMLDSIVKRAIVDSFFAEIGLAFISLESENPEAFKLYLNKAKIMADTNTQKLYINLLLSRWHELYGKIQDAQRLAMENLEISNYCFDAKHRLIQLSALNHSDLSVIQQVAKLASTERCYFMIAVLDPKLNPAGAALENFLAVEYDSVMNSGRTLVSGIKEEYEELKQWLGDGEACLKPILDGVGNLDSLISKNSYFAAEDVVAISTKLSAAMKILVEAKLKELHANTAKTEHRWRKSSALWERYPYKSYFSDFPEKLSTGLNLLMKVKRLVAEKDIKSYLEAVTVLQDARKMCEKLESCRARMIWLRDFIDLIRAFVSRLIISEALALTIWIVGMAAIVMFEKSPFIAGIGSFLSEKSFRVFSFVALHLFIAPLMSIVTTMRSGMSSTSAET